MFGRKKKDTTHVSAQLKVGNKGTIILIYLCLTIAALAVLLPIIWLFLSSIKTKPELSQNIWGFPAEAQWNNYYLAWTRPKLGRYMTNSLYATLLTVILADVLSVTAAFVLARFRFKMNRILYYFFIAGMMIPIQACVIPLYVMVGTLGLKNNLTVLGFVYASFRIPFSVFVLEGFMSQIPKEMEESAFIDGCSIPKMFSRIILPLSVDGIATISILSMLSSWNEVLVAMLLLDKAALKTLPIGLKGFVTEYEAEYPQMAAGLMLALIPSILFYILAQEKIVKGMTAGAVKG